MTKCLPRSRFLAISDHENRAAALRKTVMNMPAIEDIVLKSGSFVEQRRPFFPMHFGITKSSDVFVSEGDNSPFPGARRKLTSYSDSPYPKPHSTHFLVPTGIFGRIYRTEQYFGPRRGCCSGRKPVRFGKSAQKYPRVPRNVWSGVSGTGNPNMKLVLV